MKSTEHNIELIEDYFSRDKGNPVSAISKISSHIPYTSQAKIIFNILSYAYPIVKPEVIYVDNKNGKEGGAISDKNDNNDNNDNNDKGTNNSYRFIPYIKLPSSGEIGHRLLMSILYNIFITLPCFTINSLHTAPIPTAICLYYMLPKEIWDIIYPNILSYIKFY